MSTVPIPSSELAPGERVLLYLYQQSQRRLFLPGPRAISKALGLKGKSAVPYQIQRLRSLGYLVWEPGRSGRREITRVGAEAGLRLTRPVRRARS